eukprot:GSChrysophyteH1.ASY1.ANO1.146.1 assembled CDS
MGKGRKRSADPAGRHSGPSSKRSSAFVTANAFNMPLAANSSNLSSLSIPDVGRVWIRKNEKLDECVYHIALSEPHPIIVICGEADVANLTGTLKNLFRPHESEDAAQVVSATIKQQRTAIAKALRKSVRVKRGIIVTSTECAMLVKSCLPQGIWCKTVVHAGTSLPSPHEIARTDALTGQMGIQGVQEAAAGGAGSGKAEGGKTSEPGSDGMGNNGNNGASAHIYLLENTFKQPIPQAKLSPFIVRRGWIPCLQARCSAARKLASTMQIGNLSVWASGDKDARTLAKAVEVSREESERGRALAGRMDSLKAKLKIAMCSPLPGYEPWENVTTSSTKASPDIEIPKTPELTQQCSSKSRRLRMELLGMVRTPSAEEIRFQAVTGRNLAATRWLDGMSCADAVAQTMSDEDGQLLSQSWKIIRLGAKCDSVSARVRTIVEGFRGFVSHHTGRNMPKREEEVQLLMSLSNGTRNALTSGRITALGWRPSSFGGEEWGGNFGKCCAHNEVAMFYIRPFFPQEVLNTHVCSRSSPAPGNEGFDGCLEFLVAQSRFFQKAMTVWDDRYFHHIASDGEHTRVEKNEFVLRYSEAGLKDFMDDLRRWTIETRGVFPISKFLEMQGGRYPGY